MKKLKNILNYFFRNVSHGTDFQEIRQVEASTKFREASIMDEDSLFNQRSSTNTERANDDLSDLLGGGKKVEFSYFLKSLF